MEKLEPGLHSTKGIGKTEPDPAGSKELDGCKVKISGCVKVLKTTKSPEKFKKWSGKGPEKFKKWSGKGPDLA